MPHSVVQCRRCCHERAPVISVSQHYRVTGSAMVQLYNTHTELDYYKLVRMAGWWQAEGHKHLLVPALAAVSTTHPGA